MTDADEPRRDLYEDGWREGINQARVVVRNAKDCEDALFNLEKLLFRDYSNQKKRRKK